MTILATWEVTYIDRWGITHKKVIITDNFASAVQEVRDTVENVVVVGAKQKQREE